MLVSSHIIQRWVMVNFLVESVVLFFSRVRNPAMGHGSFFQQSQQSYYPCMGPGSFFQRCQQSVVLLSSQGSWQFFFVQSVVILSSYGSWQIFQQSQQSYFLVESEIQLWFMVVSFSRISCHVVQLLVMVVTFSRVSSHIIHPRPMHTDH